jgi:uncharacterized protein (TIGR03086 family)
MTPVSEIAERHQEALTAAWHVLAAVGPEDLERPTPCAGWDLRALVEHMIGQNEGFALAMATGDAPRTAYAPRPVRELTALSPAWAESVRHLRAAPQQGDPGRRVRLAEISTERTFSLVAALRMQLLDTVVHTWDVAAALGRDHRPSADLLDLVAADALLVPDGPARLAPGAAFTPALPTEGGDPWSLTLARLGRDRRDPLGSRTDGSAA